MAAFRQQAIWPTRFARQIGFWKTGWKRGRLLFRSGLVQQCSERLSQPVIALRRPTTALRALFASHPELHAAVLAITVAAAIGLVVNDSGIAVLAGVALVTGPAVGAAAAYEWLAEGEERRGNPALSDAVLP